MFTENQLEDTNHDHLGKLITYASGKLADVIVWVVKHARDEHKKAIKWLNEHTDEEISFFLCEIKLYRIGDSEPAVSFEVIERPNGWTKKTKKIKPSNEIQRKPVNPVNNDIRQQRYDYWAAFLDYASQNPSFAKNFKPGEPSERPKKEFSAGYPACKIAVSQIRLRNELEVELYIEDDKKLFHSLFENKDSIEADTKLKFDWLEQPDRKASRITIEKNVNFDDMSQWNKQFDWIIDVMLKMKKAFKKYF